MQTRPPGITQPVASVRSRDDQQQNGCQRGTTKESTMLVLSRKKNESIVINNDITIVVVEIRGDKVRLGVEAPKEVPVHRREVYEAIHRHNNMPGSNVSGSNVSGSVASGGVASGRTVPAARDS